MRVAVPVFEGHVSSVFDWARQLVVYVGEPDAASPAKIAKIEIELDGLGRPATLRLDLCRRIGDTRPAAWRSWSGLRGGREQ